MWYLFGVAHCMVVSLPLLPIELIEGVKWQDTIWNNGMQALADLRMEHLEFQKAKKAAYDYVMELRDRLDA